METVIIFKGSLKHLSLFNTYTLSSHCEVDTAVYGTRAWARGQSHSAGKHTSSETQLRECKPSRRSVRETGRFIREGIGERVGVFPVEEDGGNFLCLGDQRDKARWCGGHANYTRKINVGSQAEMRV